MVSSRKTTHPAERPQRAARRPRDGLAGARGRANRQREARGSKEPGAARTTSTLDDLVAIRVVVVGQLFTGLDVPAGANPDVPSDDLAVAVRAARMIDEASDVATDHGVAHPAAVHRKAP